MGFAIAGAALVGAYMQSNAATDAANTQADAAANASSNQMAMYQQQRADAQPWRDAGGKALGGLQDPKFQQSFNQMSYQSDPGYQFRLDEGNKAINASASSRGMANSGATMKALTRYGQDYASGEYQKAYDRFNNDQTNQFNRLATVAGLGQTSNTQLAQAGSNTATQVGNNGMAAANAQAAGQVGAANAYSGAANQGANSWMQYQMMNRNQYQQGSGSGSGGYGTAGNDWSGNGNMA